MSWLRDLIGCDRSPVMLAPMAGVNDTAFRTLCLEKGADLTYTEMVSSKALSFANEKTSHLVDLADAESLAVVQLFGHEPDVMAQQAAWVEERLGDRLAYIDVNMGCPARKITKKGDGSALMRDPQLASRIIAAIYSAVSHPVTCKFRKGYNADDNIAVDFALRMQEAGACAVAVHGRTAAQFYAGAADWDVIRDVVSALSIPVIGNGDVHDGASALALIEHSGCDALMIGRASQGNPWVFAEVRSALCGDPRPDAPTIADRLETAHRHAVMVEKRFGGNLSYMRKHAMWYLHGIPGASQARGRLNYCTTLADFEAVFDEVLRQNQQPVGSWS